MLQPSTANTDSESYVIYILQWATENQFDPLLLLNSMGLIPFVWNHYKMIIIRYNQFISITKIWHASLCLKCRESSDFALISGRYTWVLNFCISQEILRYPIVWFRPNIWLVLVSLHPYLHFLAKHQLNSEHQIAPRQWHFWSKN